MNSICLDDLKFKHPFTFIVCGMTSSGKSEFTRRLIKNWKNLFKMNSNSLRVLWCYSEAESIKPVNANNLIVEYYKGIPNYEILESTSPNVLIIDDLMDEITLDVKKLFTKKSHHKSISVIFIVQNLFVENKYMRDISRNTHYFAMMKSLSNSQQMDFLARRLFGRKAQNAVIIFEHATRRNFSYLIIDSHPQSDKKYQLRTRIFREELPSELAKFHSQCPIIYDINKPKP